MKIVLQKVSESSVLINGKVISAISKGFLLLVGISTEDSQDKMIKAADKISSLRVFPDDKGKMNLNIHEVKGSVLSVPQFTIVGSTNKGNRPGFDNAAPPEKAKKLWDIFNKELKAKGLNVEKGVFGAYMTVRIINDGPVTFIFEN